MHQAKANIEVILLFFNWDLWVAGYRNVVASKELLHQSREYTGDTCHGATNGRFPWYFSRRFLLFFGAVSLYGVGSLSYIGMAGIEEGRVDLPRVCEGCYTSYGNFVAVC